MIQITATFDVYIDTGGTDGSPGTSASLTNLRFKSADDNTQDSNNPCVIPASSSNYSYWRSLYLRCSGAPNTSVNNVKFYSGGSLGWGTGITAYVGNAFPTKNHAASTGYKLATGTPGTTGTLLNSTNYPSTGTATDVTTYTSGSPLSVTISESGSNIVNIGDTTNYVVMQLTIASTATSGTKSPVTLTFQYDEI